MRIPRLLVVFMLLPACHGIPLQPPPNPAAQVAHHYLAAHYRHASRAPVIALPMRQASIAAPNFQAVAVQILGTMTYCYVTQTDTIDCGSY